MGTTICNLGKVPGMLIDLEASEKQPDPRHRFVFELANSSAIATLLAACTDPPSPLLASTIWKVSIYLDEGDVSAIATGRVFADPFRTLVAGFDEGRSHHFVIDLRKLAE